MTLPNVEHPAAPGTSAQPTQPASGAGGTASAIDVEALLAALEPKVTTLVERQVQSQKDKRIAGMQGELDGFKGQLARMNELIKKGFNQDQALEIMELEKPQPTTRSPQQPAPAQGGTQGQQVSVDTASILSVMGLDANEPAIAEILRTTPDVLGQVAAFTKLAVSRRQQPSPPVAQQMPASTGASVQSENIETLSAELAELNLKPGTNMPRIMAINKKLRELRGR